MQFSRGINILILFLISFLILLIVLGNSIVMLAFVVDKRLRNQSNFFLLNLAICDFLVGAITVPVYVPFMFTGKWIFGRFLCKIWLTVNYTTSTASAFNIVLISYDRFLSVIKAVYNRSVQNSQSQTAIKIALVWIFPFLIYVPAIIFWEIITGTNIVPEYSCRAGFIGTWYFLLGASSLDFAFPMISISFFNLRIFWNIHKRSRKKRNGAAFGKSEKRPIDVTPYIIATNDVLTSTQANGIEKSKSSQYETVNATYLLDSKANFSSQIGKLPNKVQFKVIKLSRDKKAAKSLAILVSVFALCWAPYSFLVSIRAACQGSCIGSLWYEITIWLLFSNSAINPILYPMCHKSFRNAFKLLFHKCLKFFTT
ncbi:hypothetical protein GDO86_011065 [Hymenochirus boettgeri]|uniref:G-protein coupled receptors family 1 profile domain-containing protein n=1 Tax=Hymenochirus boettgeri TaxID=247094 RepID=A0A8T2JA57_9PIPI|nr:hypothetical protein GDO86_011065 [Hymenochirus boettgeri]